MFNVKLRDAIIRACNAATAYLSYPKEAKPDPLVNVVDGSYVRASAVVGLLKHGCSPAPDGSKRFKLKIELVKAQHESKTLTSTRIFSEEEIDKWIAAVVKELKSTC